MRGSTPCACDDNRRYGGNTSCVSLEAAGEDPIVLDLGTGLRFWGQTLTGDGPFRGTALVSHIHWDHIQGLPFFAPIIREGAHLDVYGPTQASGTLAEAVDSFLCPPYFPVTVRELKGHIEFHDVNDGDLAIGNAKVRVRQVPHIGPTNGYRVDWEGASVAYVSDHQSPGAHAAVESDHIDEAVLDLCDGADVLIHDAQYWADEWQNKAHWGHCSVDYAVRVALASGVKRLVLFHHDPSHGDAEVDKILRHARTRAGSRLDEVIAASEGLTIALDR
ncbi:MAG: MBL fold metallo-hydrolase [Acidobacteria bacterium]|nr:MBL fold metallo-hydrolase [Acidobacteriota bacterium]